MYPLNITIKVNIRNYTFIVFLLFISCIGKSQERVVVNIPTAESEAEYIWRTIRDIKFFEQNNYQVSLPQGKFMEDLKTKARNNQLSDEDFDQLKIFMQKSIYDKSNYIKGYSKIKEQLPLLNKMLKEIETMPWKWGFKSYDQYQINLTLYGPGGSYDPDEGTILIYTTPKGQFKNYDNPINTLIHEIIHIGIEKSIIQKHHTSHPLKERIVDQIVSLCFRQYLPDYKIQHMGDHRIDAFLKTKEDIHGLDKFVEEIVSKD